MSDGAKKPQVKRIFANVSDERRVRAYDKQKNSVGTYQLNILPVSSISKLSGMGGMSNIHLHDGSTIEVALSCDELSRRIYDTEFSNAPEIDLGDVTGEGCFIRDIAPIGTKMDDGTIYVGISSEAKAPLMLLVKTDVSVSYWDAHKHIDKMNEEKAEGHSDWRLATYSEAYEIKAALVKHSLFRETFNGAARAVYWSGYKQARGYRITEDSAYALVNPAGKADMMPLDVKVIGSVLAVRCPKILK